MNPDGCASSTPDVNVLTLDNQSLFTAAISSEPTRSFAVLNVLCDRSCPRHRQSAAEAQVSVIYQKQPDTSGAALNWTARSEVNFLWNRGCCLKSDRHWSMFCLSGSNFCRRTVDIDVRRCALHPDAFEQSVSTFSPYQRVNRLMFLPQLCSL